MFIVVVYCPLSHVELIKEAMFSAGGGQLGLYEKCSFEYEGFGQFKAMTGAEPFIGKVGEVERVKEIRVEMVCTEGRISQVLVALKASHPYQEPAYHILKNYSDQFEH